ncbi:glutaminase [Synechococcus sp. PCC 6312]|uniref:glutaminase n=1 Tax=Synechococcus sp. (strain ATCC 27167 / PCC 6312) TaxID=195253 RepID=UPI00029F086C|nr:glutaminase [Synechococcus sp. PCC 6312]AFY60688.1 glutaminase [Synechococcus sp. PCC 6312]
MAITSRDRLNQLDLLQLERWAESVQGKKLSGKILERLPSDPQEATIAIASLDDHRLAWGSTGATFPLMSVVKPFLLLYLLETLGAEVVFQKVGIQPSARPYNSVVELEIDQGWPRNPMINSGAICLASLLPGESATAKCDALRHWLNHVSGAQLVLDQQVLAQVNAHPNWQNRGITHLLNLAGHFEHPQLVLDSYNQICCLRTTVTDLAALGLVLAGKNPQIGPKYRQLVNGIMLTCGLYEDSAQMMAHIGLPMKSGVSGAMVAIIPQAGAIAVYSPLLDETGNSVWSLALLEEISQSLELSILS